MLEKLEENFPNLLDIPTEPSNLHIRTYFLEPTVLDKGQCVICYLLKISKTNLH